MDHVGYHGTAASFTHFSEEMFGSDDSRSPNGALGVWVFTNRSYADRFATGAGGRCLRVTSSAAKAIRIGYDQMVRDHAAAERTDDPVGWFRRMRAELLLNGYGRIDVLEDNGAVDMSVLLDLNSIVSVDDVAH